MKFFLDTANVEQIKKGVELGMCDGVTTNPTLIMKEGKDHKVVMSEIIKACKGPVSVEGIGETYEELMKEAIEFSKWGSNVVFKVPMTKEGLRAVRTCSEKGIKTNVTLIFSSNQALLAAKAGATYVSPFIGRLDDVTSDGVQLIQEIRTIFDNYDFKTQILGASIRHPLHVRDCALIGCDVVTMPFDVLEKMWKHPLTDAGFATFKEHHAKSKK